MKQQYYSKKYYDWQKKSGKLGALIDQWKFEQYIKAADTVLDFGCGGGYILESLNCKRKYGVDVNTVALEQAKQKGIRTFSTLADLPKNIKFDVVISHHTLEHLENPAEILKELRARTRPGGLAVHILPINDWRNDKKYNPKDINKHLYTWTPLLLGNLFSQCGYKIQSIEILTHAWLPLSKYMYRILPHSLYHIGCNVWSFATRNRQIRIVAKA